MHNNSTTQKRQIHMVKEYHAMMPPLQIRVVLEKVGMVR